MNKHPSSFFINSVLKLGIILILILGATTKQQYSFYTLLRWGVMIPFIYFAYQCYERKEIGLLIFFAMTALLFNPFQKVWFEKETWHLIDFIVAGITAITILFEWMKLKKI